MKGGLCQLGTKSCAFPVFSPPCQFPVSPTSSTLLVTVVESFPGLFHKGGYCVIIPPLPHHPFVPLYRLLWVVMMNPPSELASTSITSGGALPQNCAFQAARRPCSVDNRCQCACRPSQFELHTPFRWLFMKNWRFSSMSGLASPLISSAMSMARRSLKNGTTYSCRMCGRFSKTSCP